MFIKYYMLNKYYFSNTKIIYFIPKQKIFILRDLFNCCINSRKYNIESTKSFYLNLKPDKEYFNQ